MKDTPRSVATTRAPLMAKPWWHSTYAALALLAAAALTATAASAATPTTALVEGVLTAAGGAPAADGDYELTVAIYADATTKAPAWSEAGLKAQVVGGRFSLVIGASKPLDAKVLAGLTTPTLGVTVGNEPELPRKALRAAPYAIHAAHADAVSCTGCLGGDQIADGGIASAKVGFNYAASSKKGGPALDLACTGCVGVAELAFDDDVDLGGNSLKASNGTFSGDVVAKTVTATAFVGDGSKLTGISSPKGQCKAGEAVVGIAADGALICKSSADTLPKDGISAVSNGLLSNQFVDAEKAPSANVAIPDNTGSDAASTIDFPDLGVAQGLKISVKVTNTDLSSLRLKLLTPADKKVGYVLCDPCGEADAKLLEATWSDQKAPKSGDLAEWLGKNPKGTWILVATDSKFCLPQAPGNAALCDLNAKTDGVIADWSIEAQTLSSKKVAATSALQLLPAATAPFACTENHMGAIYFDKVAKALRYCDGAVWRTLADTCGNGILESNEACDDGNNTDGDGCSATCQTVCGDGKKVGKEECDDGNKIDTDACSNTCVAGYGTIKDKPGKSCLDILDTYAAGGGKAPDGSYWIKTPKDQVIAVDCDMTSEGGGYTYLPIASGKTTSRSTDDNSCKDYGLDIVYPRSKAQWTWMLSKYGSSYFTTIPGVTKPGNGGNYTGCVMRHPGSYGSGCGDWKVPDGGRWWLRDSTYSEPNGDYTANCWLSMYQHDANDIRFNDGNCSYSTSKYLCSTNDKK
jgi:cysteine-rich repeat protein